MAEEFAFSSQVKDELAHYSAAEECCQRMELAALLRACGRIGISGGRLTVTLATDHAPVARKLFRLLKLHFQLQTKIVVMRRRRLRKNLTYRVHVPPQDGLSQMLLTTGITDEDGSLQEWADMDEFKHDGCRRAYLRGAFLGSGWVAAPERQHHLEMTTVVTEAADAIGQLLFSYGIPVRMAMRKEVVLLYLKDADGIMRFLSLVGAYQSRLKYEDVRIVKEMKNRVNRQVNAETANLTKTVDAAAKQVEALERLRAAGRLSELSTPLRELALLRLNHPDASLKELGELCHPPLGKSGVNHRMRQLMQFASQEN